MMVQRDIVCHQYFCLCCFNRRVCTEGQAKPYCVTCLHNINMDIDLNTRASCILLHHRFDCRNGINDSVVPKWILVSWTEARDFSISNFKLNIGYYLLLPLAVRASFVRLSCLSYPLPCQLGFGFADTTSTLLSLDRFETLSWFSII
jgi:hypothetical protein